MKYKEKELKKLLDGVDVVHLEGGNTFRLLRAVRESGFKKILDKLLPNGLVYI
jgi:peptidase E